MAGPLVELEEGDVHTWLSAIARDYHGAVARGDTVTGGARGELSRTAFQGCRKTLLAGTDVIIVTCEWNPAVAGDAI